MEQASARDDPRYKRLSLSSGRMVYRSSVSLDEASAGSTLPPSVKLHTA